MIHCAIMGSIERFLSIFIEHHAGLFPLWCAPVQMAVVPVAAAHDEAATTLVSELKSVGIRAVLFPSDDSLGKRIREGEKQKIPYLLVIGDKEVETRSVAVRNVKTKQQVTVSLTEFLEKTAEDIAERRLEASIG